MSTKNPLSQYRNELFGSRGVDVASALDYVDQLANGSMDPIAVRTACHVLLNTVVGAVDQILNAPSAERLALIELIDERMIDHIDARVKAATGGDINQQISDWFDNNVDIEDTISDWMSNNFDVTDYNLTESVNDAVNEWMSDSLADEVERVIKNSLTFSVIVS